MFSRQVGNLRCSYHVTLVLKLMLLLAVLVPIYVQSFTISSPQAIKLQRATSIVPRILYMTTSDTDNDDSRGNTKPATEIVGEYRDNLSISRTTTASGNYNGSEKKKVCVYSMITVVFCVCQL
jgi:hypothetical protein